MDPKIHLTIEDGVPLANSTPYRELICSRVMPITRPDVIYAVNRLSQFFSKPTDVHLQAAYKVLRYIKNDPGQGLLSNASLDLTLTAYVDADWGECPNSRRSVFGYYVFVGGLLVSWKSKKQGVVSRSSAEAEYWSLANTKCDLLWLKQLLDTFKVTIKLSFTLFVTASLHFT